MNAAPSQRPHPLFSWLIPKELINMHEAAISIGTKDRACTLALWRSIRNTKGLLRGKLSVSLALGWVDARAHTSKKKKGTLKAYITHRERGRLNAHKASTYTPEGPDTACIYTNTITEMRSRCLPTVSNSLHPSFSSFFPPPFLLRTEFVMSLKIGPFHLLSLKCHYLRKGGGGGGMEGAPRRRNIFFPL